MDARKAGEVIGTVLAVAWFAVATVVTLRAFTAGYDRYGHAPGVEVYVIGVDMFKEHDGGDAFMLTYAVSGAIQAVEFRHAERLEDYMRYLRSLGTMSSAPALAKSGAGL